MKIGLGSVDVSVLWTGLGALIRRTLATSPALVLPAYMDADSNTPGPSNSDQSTFDRWRRKFSMITGLGGTKEERAADMEEYHHQMCEKWKKELMTYSQY